LKQVKQETDPKIIYAIMDNFVEDGEWTKKIMAEKFISVMKNAPDDICVIVGYDDNKISGYLVCRINRELNLCYLDQVYSVDTEISEMGFEKMLKWCEKNNLKGRNLIFETERDRVGFCAMKRYGFSEHSVIMTRQI